MAGVAVLVDRAVALPPGPELSAVLDALPREKVPNTRLIEVARARARQLAHEQAGLFADMVEITHAVAVADLPGDRAEAVARAAEQFEWASHEIAAGLTWTPTATDRELGFATALVERLPLVYECLRQGHIDRGRARVLVEYLDPANGDLTDQQSRRLCEKFVPQAPGLTTKQLSDRLYRALHAIDPDLRRRRYQRAVQGRGVALYLDPRTGTATLVGNGLPRTRRRPRASGSTGWWRPPNGPDIQRGGPRSAPTSTSECSTARSTASRRTTSSTGSSPPDDRKTASTPTIPTTTPQPVRPHRTPTHPTTAAQTTRRHSHCRSGRERRSVGR